MHAVIRDSPTPPVFMRALKVIRIDIAGYRWLSDTYECGNIKNRLYTGHDNVVSAFFSSCTTYVGNRCGASVTSTLWWLVGVKALYRFNGTPECSAGAAMCVMARGLACIRYTQINKIDLSSCSTELNNSTPPPVALRLLEGHLMTLCVTNHQFRSVSTRTARLLSHTSRVFPWQNEPLTQLTLPQIRWGSETAGRLIIKTALIAAVPEKYGGSALAPLNCKQMS